MNGRKPLLRGAVSTVSISVALVVSLAACGPGQQSDDQTESELSTPSSMTLTGSGTNTINGADYLFATAAGTVDSSGNVVTATFTDPNTPLELNSDAAYSQVMSTGSCTTLGTLYSEISGAAGNQVTTQLSATGCTDQAIIEISLDTTQLFDSYGFEGTNVVSIYAAVDLAPTVAAAATGNSAADGSGTTEGTAGYFSLSGDHSVVVKFSKSMLSGTYNATLAGCTATLGTPVVVANSSNTTLAWPLTNLSGITTGGTCTLNVSRVTDGVGNADDPSDTNINMTITFH